MNLLMSDLPGPFRARVEARARKALQNTALRGVLKRLVARTGGEVILWATSIGGIVRAYLGVGQSRAARSCLAEVHIGTWDMGEKVVGRRPYFRWQDIDRRRAMHAGCPPPVRKFLLFNNLVRTTPEPPDEYRDR